MDAPRLPESRDITLADKPAFDAYFHARQPELSTYTFSNLYAWREPHETQVSLLGDAIIVHYNHDDRRLCLEPLAENPAEVIGKILDEFGAEADFVRIPADTANVLKDTPALELQSDRDNSDYLYLASDLIRLEGRKYDGKRNFISRFKSSTAYEYVSLDRQTAMECHDFMEAWCEERKCESVEGLRRERCAVWEMLSNFEVLGIRGGAIKIDGAVVAFALGGPLNDETLVCHVEKADSKIDGLYQIINNEFAIHEGAGYRYINREQDLGIPGLRKAKKSYQPVRLVEAYRISRL